MTVHENTDRSNAEQGQAQNPDALQAMLTRRSRQLEELQTQIAAVFEQTGVKTLDDLARSHTAGREAQTRAAALENQNKTLEAQLFDFNERFKRVALDGAISAALDKAGIREDRRELARPLFERLVQFDQETGQASWDEVQVLELGNSMPEWKVRGHNGSGVPSLPRPMHHQADRPKVNLSNPADVLKHREAIKSGNFEPA